MNYSHDFADYANNPADLIGKPVFLSSRYNKGVSKICHVTKTGFRIDGDTALFSLVNGYKKTSDHWNTSHCTIISEARKEELITEFKQKNEMEKIKSLLQKNIQTLSYSQLIGIYEIIKAANETNP